LESLFENFPLEWPFLDNLDTSDASETRLCQTPQAYVTAENCSHCLMHSAAINELSDRLRTLENTPANFRQVTDISTRLKDIETQVREL
jgi:hypothetical protein